MKVLRTYYIFLFSTVVISQEKEVIKYEDLYERNGLIYASDQDSSFNGTVDENWPTGINKLSYTYKDGKPNSKWSDWFNNGQPKEEVEYSDGIKNGLHKQWYKNGQQKYERTYKNGIHDGKWTEWYENGQSMVEGNFLDGKPDGTWIYWYPMVKKERKVTQSVAILAA